MSCIEDAAAAIYDILFIIMYILLCPIKKKEFARYRDGNLPVKELIVSTLPFWMDFCMCFQIFRLLCCYDSQSLITTFAIVQYTRTVWSNEYFNFSDDNIGDKT